MASAEKKGSIHIKASHRGWLHRDLGIPQGKPIPEEALDQALSGKYGLATKKRAQFAKNAKSWGK